MFRVGHKPIKTERGWRQPGEPLPEAESWPDPESAIRTGEIIHIPDDLAGGRSEPPAFEARELLEMMDPRQLKDLCARRGVATKGLGRAELVEALLAPPAPEAAPQVESSTDAPPEPTEALPAAFEGEPAPTAAAETIAEGAADGVDVRSDGADSTRSGSRSHWRRR